MTATLHGPVPARLLPPVAPDGGDPPASQVVTVFSAKGGAGTTVVATNLAMALQVRGVRVCLLDLALAFGDVAVSLQLVPRRTVVDTLELGTSRDALSELITTHPSGLDCVLAPVDPSGLERVPVEIIRRLISALRERYDLVVIDTPSELSEHVLEAVDSADRLLLVTTPEIPAIKNTRIGLDVLDLLGHPRERRLVLLNQLDSSLEITVADVETALQCEIVAQLPFDRAVAQSVNHGVPLVAAKPGHPISEAIRALTTHVVTGMPSMAVAAEGRAGRLRRTRRTA